VHQQAAGTAVEGRSDARELSLDTSRYLFRVIRVSLKQRS
jgi:hypothetical protein